MISIVYACNGNYIRQTLVSMASVWKFNTEAEVFLIGDGLSQEHRNMVITVAKKYGEQVTFLELESVLPKLDLDSRDRHPHTIYAKLFLDRSINRKRILYLDSDVIVQGSLMELFQRDMSDELAAGVLMYYGSKVKQNMQIPIGTPYICDGVVLLNLELWKKERISQQCVEKIRVHNGRPPMLSESVLNEVCAGRIGILPPKYNLMPTMIINSLEEIYKLYRADTYYTDINLLNEAKQNPTIIHFMNELYNRPWFEPCEHPFRDSYRIMEHEIFGKNIIIEKPLEKHTQMTVCLRKYLPFPVFTVLYHIKNGII